MQFALTNGLAFARIGSSGLRNAPRPPSVEAETINGQEFIGGACSKTCAPRNGDWTHCGLNAGIFENCTGAVISGACAG